MAEIKGDLDGRLTMTRTRDGDARDKYQLELNGRFIFKVQRILEKQAVNEEDYFKVREAVLLAEELREAVKLAKKQGPPQGDESGE